MNNETTKYVITTMTGGRQQKVVPTIYTSLLKAVAAGVNLASSEIKQSKSSAKSVYAIESTESWNAYQIYARFGAKVWQQKVYNIIPLEIFSAF